MSYDGIFSAEKFSASVVDVLSGSEAAFASEPADHLELTMDGLVGDRHYGAVRKASVLEPWYTRGTPMKNDRQLTVVSPGDLKAIAAGMEIDHVKPEWLAANLVLDGIPNLSMLPPGAILIFEGGASLRVRGQNPPCKNVGNEIGRHHPERTGFDLLFPKVAKRLRGLLAYVETPGVIRPGEDLTVRIPEQWIYHYSHMEAAEKDAVA